MKHPVPAPPRDLLDAMSDAARDGNTVALALHEAAYRKWLIDNGYQIQGNHAPEKAWE